MTLTAPLPEIEVSTVTKLPVAIIGAGPVGLAAAAELLQRGIEPLVLEQGDRAGAAILSGVTSASSRRGSTSSIVRPQNCSRSLGGRRSTPRRCRRVPSS